MGVLTLRLKTSQNPESDILQPCPCLNVARKLWLERRHPLPASWCRLIAAENNCSNRNASITESSWWISIHSPFSQHLGNAQIEAWCVSQRGPYWNIYAKLLQDLLLMRGLQNTTILVCCLFYLFKNYFYVICLTKSGQFWDFFYNLVMYLF